MEGEDRSLASRAFARLPERWQEALWHTEIEGLSPADAAPLMGLSPNGMSALAYRARGGLREAYLQVHLAQTGGPSGVDLPSTGLVPGLTPPLASARGLRLTNTSTSAHRAVRGVWNWRRPALSSDDSGR
jgi:hypothetical protein